MEFRPIFLSLKHYKVFSLMIIVQVALTFTAVTYSSLGTYSLVREWNVPSGLRQENQIWAWPQFYDLNVNIEPVVEDDLQKLRALPGVRAVTTTNAFPFANEQVSNIYRDSGENAQTFATNIFEMDQTAIDALGVELLEGRTFSANEVVRGERSSLTSYPSVALISQQQATAMFEGQSAVGQTIWLGQNSRPVQVIGVYSNFMNGESLNAQGMSYHTVVIPLVAWTQRANSQYLIRTEPGAAEGLLESIRSVLYKTPGRYLYRVEVLTLAKKRMYDGRGSQALIMMLVSGVLIIITGLGMAGLVSFLVTQRVKQIGVRRALGAKKIDIQRYFLLENSIVTWIGLAVGMVFILIMTYQQLAESGENFLRIHYMVIIALFLWAVNLVAIYIPAHRATRIEPAIVTR